RRRGRHGGGHWEGGIDPLMVGCFGYGGLLPDGGDEGGGDGQGHGDQGDAQRVLDGAHRSSLAPLATADNSVVVGGTALVAVVELPASVPLHHVVGDGRRTEGGVGVPLLDVE